MTYLPERAILRLAVFRLLPMFVERLALWLLRTRLRGSPLEQTFGLGSRVQTRIIACVYAGVVQSVEHYYSGIYSKPVPPTLSGPTLGTHSLAFVRLRAAGTHQ